MAPLRTTVAQRGWSQASAPRQLQQLRRIFQRLHSKPDATSTKQLSTMTTGANVNKNPDIPAGSSFGISGPRAQEMDGQEKPQRHLRVVPISLSYFSRLPGFNDSYLKLLRLKRETTHLPIMPPDQVQKVAFMKLQAYRSMVGESVKESDYNNAIALVKRLHQIRPSVSPPQVKSAVAEFVRDSNPHLNKPDPIEVDRFGRALGVGRRKTSTARAWVVEGTGEVLINGKSLSEVFGRVHDRESAMWALKASQRVDKYNVWALVSGGGTTGQAEALALAVAKALLAHEPALKPVLRRAGVVTRDPRSVERKKHGHLKARKKPAWVKR